MPSIRSRLIRTIIKKATSKPDRKETIEEKRVKMDRLGKWLKAKSSVVIEKQDIDGMYAELLSFEKSKKDKILLYLHGGAFQYGSCETHRGLAAEIAQQSGIQVLLPEYRLAPEYPFPYALEDVLTAYQWLLNEGFEPKDIFLGGDSAGGGLALSMTLTLRNNGEQLPKGIICISPWADLTSGGPSYTENKGIDPVLKRVGIKQAAYTYAGMTDLDHPLVSPVFANYTGFPPLLIQVGSDELLLSDAETITEKATKQGVSVTLNVWPGMWHVWHLSGRFLPESKKAIKELGEFIKQQL